MKERGGDIRTEVIPNVKMTTLCGVTLRNVEKGSVVSTDELMSYGLLDGGGYKHGTVTHSQKDGRTTITGLAKLTRPIMLRVFGTCSKRRFARRISMSLKSTWTATLRNSLSARTMA